MKYLGPVSNEKDLVKKEYVDEQLENKLGKTETAAAAKKIDIQAISRNVSTNLNNYVTDGIYSWAAGTTSMMNEPTGETGLGIMFVTANKDNANYLTQEIHYLYNASAVRIYRRNKFDTTWTAWDRVLTANQGYVPDYAGTLESIPIENNADLNEYTDQGFYVSGANSVVANYTNCPTTSAFSMFVYWSYNNSATATQELHIYSTSNPKIYVRSLYSGAWGAWKEISFKGDSVSVASEANKLSTAREIKVDLESSEAASFDGTQDITPGISGVLPVSNGGTGLSASPSILINLASTAAANVLTASPRPGITGTLSISHGGTGSTTAAAVLTNLGITATAAELNHLDGITATVTELNYTDGVTSNIQTQLNAKAALASPTFTGTPKAPTAAAGTNTTQIATTAYVKTEINNVLAAAGALIYKGTIGTDGTITALPASHTVGDTYVVSTAGNYTGETCEIGDMIICVTTRTTANNADWNIVQTNINGAVTGPASAVTNRVATFNGTTGKVIKDSGFTIASSVPANAKFTDTTYTLSSFGITATATELNRLDGITATTAELNYTDGVTSNIQTQLNGKQATVTGGASTITSSNLTASRALVSNSSGKVAVSSVTSTELGYLDGVTSNVQTQLEAFGYTPNSKLVHIDPTFKRGTNDCVVYNNSSNSNVTMSRVVAPSGTPTDSGYVLRIQNKGTATPGIGGFIQSISGRANATFLIRYLMNIPTGYTVRSASNSMGSGYTDTWLTSTAGTGKWAWYVRKVQCGASGTFTSGGHTYLEGTVGTASAPVTWYVGAIYCYDITQAEDPVIKNLSISGRTITYTKSDGSTGTLTTQDTNTTYTLSSFGITATAAELNKLDGVTTTAAEFNYVHGTTSNIQTQINNVKPKLVTVTLSSSQWAQGSNGYTQAETVSGVSATETAQMINIIPKVSNQAAYIQAGVYASAQAANSITFTALKKPTVNLTVYVVIEKI